MIRIAVPAVAVLATALALPALAQEATQQMTPEQEAMMAAYAAAGAPGKQHEWLASTAGDYDLSIRSWDAPGSEPSEESGTATRSMALGGRVLVEQVSASAYGQPFQGHGMTGYDNASGKWWSTWNDSMSTGIMVSEGDCDDEGACTFQGSWTDPVSKQRVTARFQTRWTSPTTEQFEMYGPGPDGAEYKMMEMTYTKR